MKGQLMTRLTTLVIVLVGTVLIGAIFGSMFGPREGFETDSVDSNEKTKESKEIAELEKEVAKDETHIEDMRKVLRDTVNKIDSLERQQRGAHENDPKTNVDARQSKHIEELREVLSNTIRQLRKDDILPGGTPCGCASKPLVNPATGLAEATEGCRPPGWMRMMEREERRRRHQDECPLRQYDSPSV
jgi:uncharacterized coiled-coil protein SlyX